MQKDEQWLLEEKYGGLLSPAYEADRERLARGEPLAYTIGWQPFLGLKIYLDSRPLIPRPETEWWTEQLIANIGSGMKKVWPSGARSPEDFLKTAPDVRVLDLCSGSGAIGCALLAKLHNAEVYFGEIDQKHERTILKNIRANGLDESRARIGIGDLFGPFFGLQFDVIVANPPYIPAGRRLPDSVAKYEPSLALRAGEDGLDVIRHIAAELPRRLRRGGEAWVECDSSHAEDVAKLCRRGRACVKVLEDQYGAARVVIASLP